MPHGHQKTFAEMGSEEKNSISHRYLAAQKFLFFRKKIELDLFLRLEEDSKRFSISIVLRATLINSQSFSAI